MGMTADSRLHVCHGSCLSYLPFLRLIWSYVLVMFVGVLLPCLDGTRWRLSSNVMRRARLALQVGSLLCAPGIGVGVDMEEEVGVRVGGAIGVGVGVRVEENKED